MSTGSPRIRLRPEHKERALLGFATAATLFLSFIPFHQIYFLLLFPLAFDALLSRCRSPREAFVYGGLTSLLAHLVGFFWVTYVVHMFGDMPWVVAGLLCLGFCAIASVNMPLSSALIVGFYRRVGLPATWTPGQRAFWYLGAFPAGFTALEWAIPKIFPFYFGHSLYIVPLLTQVSELAGSSILTFQAMCGGGALVLLWRHRRTGEALRKSALLVPVALWIAVLGFGWQRLHEPEPPGKELTVALIQPNIGSLEKRAARRSPRVWAQAVVAKYVSMTDALLAKEPKPDLVLWPETAMPFSLDMPGAWQNDLESHVRRWNVPLVTGAYAVDWDNPRLDYNAAFLLTPKADGTIGFQAYRKRILLAFGEYFPGGDLFPFLYSWFPAVSHFSRGKTQTPFVLADGTPIGITICYEAIVPAFFRKTASYGVSAVLNLTNDSWFGPTTEPWHHAALASFRAIETRVPLVRVTNTGVSLVVDSRGRYSETTGVYEEGTLVTKVHLPQVPPRTLYLRFGDWFVALCALVAAGFVVMLLRKRKTNAPVPA